MTFEQWIRASVTDLRRTRNQWQAALDAGQLSYDQYLQLYSKAYDSPEVYAGKYPQAEAQEKLRANETVLGMNDAEAAFMRQRKLPAVGGTPAERWQAGQFSPQYSTWQAQSALEPETTPALWRDYLGQTPLSIRDTYQQAGNLFQQARQGTQEGQQTFLSQLGGDLENRNVGSGLKGLLDAALLGRYATPVARRMSQWIPDIATEYQAQTAGTGNRLLDMFNERLRLR